MATITLIAGAGFKDDSLVITLDGTNRRLEHLTTDYSIGVAQKIELDAPSGTYTLNLLYPKNGQELTLKVGADSHKAIRVELTPQKQLTAEVAENDEEPLF